MPFPLCIDNTIRSTIVQCLMKARYGFIEEIAPNKRSVHLHAGGAFATGLETARRAFYDRGASPADAVAEGEAALLAAYGDFDPPPPPVSGCYKTAANMTRALRYYFTTWPLGEDTAVPIRVPGNGIAVEWRFKIAIPELTHPDHGGPIFYVGRADMILDLSGLLMIEDDKTASSLGSKWIDQWDLDSQFTGYAWAYEQEHAVLPAGALIRGLSILAPKFEKIEDPDGPVIEARGRGKARAEKRFRLEQTDDGSFGHAQAVIYRPRWMIERWRRQMIRDVARFRDAYLNGEWDMALDKSACAAYGGCDYRLLCGSEHPEKYIPVNFVRRIWNPLDPT